jgi:chromosomal replication initiator protein
MGEINFLARQVVMSNITTVWNNILKELESQVSAFTFDLWIKTLQPVCIYKERLVLSTETEAHYAICEKRFRDIISKAAVKRYPSLVDVEIITPDMVSSFDNYKEFELTETEISAADEMATFFSGYTFDSFVVGKSNEFAAAVAKAVAEKVASGKGGAKYNPLFIYGGVGLGKTHLMHAIGNYIKEKKPKTKVVYVPTEKFINELLQIFRNSSNADARLEFRNKYRSVDILMLDDIQSIHLTTCILRESRL